MYCMFTILNFNKQATNSLKDAFFYLIKISKILLLFVMCIVQSAFSKFGR